MTNGVHKLKRLQQATIYITAESMSTLEALVGLDECDRDYLNSKPETRLNQREGYYLATESMRLAVLPVEAEVVLSLTPQDMDNYCRHVSFPPELRGVTYSGAPKLPENYAVILGHWSPLVDSPQYAGAQHCQNLLNQYPVPEVAGIPLDALLSNGVVVLMHGVAALTPKMSGNKYIEIAIPVNAEMLGVDRSVFDSPEPYKISHDLPVERIYLRVQDIMDSPHPDFIAIAVLHTENYDAEFFA